jgi:hypothetical protein
MGGIISGFLKGAGYGAAQAGEMLLRDKLAKERQEASDLRNAALRESTQKADHAFRTSERMEGQEFSTETEATRTENRATETALAVTDASKLQEQKDKAAMERQKYVTDNKTVNPQLIKYTTEKGLEQQGVLLDLGNGNYRIVHPQNGDVIEDKITKEELKNKAAQMNTEGNTEHNWVPWDEHGWGDSEVRDAVAKDKKKGVVASETPSVTVGGDDKKKPNTKNFGEGGDRSYSEYAEALKSRYPGISDMEIKTKWDSKQ